LKSFETDTGATDKLLCDVTNSNDWWSDANGDCTDNIFATFESLVAHNSDLDVNNSDNGFLITISTPKASCKAGSADCDS
jgi:hypothetical protein